MTSNTQPDTIDELLRNMLENYGVDVDDEYYDAPSSEYVAALSAMVKIVLGDDATDDQIKRFKEMFDGSC